MGDKAFPERCSAILWQTGLICPFQSGHQRRLQSWLGPFCSSASRKTIHLTWQFIRSIKGLVKKWTTLKMKHGQWLENDLCTVGLSFCRLVLGDSVCLLCPHSVWSWARWTLAFTLCELACPGVGLFHHSQGQTSADEELIQQELLPGTASLAHVLSVP